MYSETITSVLAENMLIVAKELKKRPKVRKYISIISIAATVLALILIALNEIFFNGNMKILGVSIVISIPSIFIFITCIMSYFIGDKKTLSEQLEKLAEEREKINTRLEKNSNVMDVIKINLNQLDEYYTINKAQAKRTYSFSITMIVIGFTLLIVGVILLLNDMLGLNITIIAGLSGAIAEFIGATSLFLYKESANQIQLFFEKLSHLQHIMLAVELTERLTDNKKAEQISAIITSLVDTKNYVI